MSVVDEFFSGIAGDLGNNNTTFEQWAYDCTEWLEVILDDISEGNLNKVGKIFDDRNVGEVAGDNATLNIIFTAKQYDKLTPPFTSGETVDGVPLDGSSVDVLTTGDDDEVYSGPIFVTALNGSDQITGSDFADILGGYHGADLIIAGAGNDFAKGGLGNDVIDGGTGNDFLSGDYSDAAKHNDNGGGDDVLNGGEGCDIVSGNQGNDEVFGDEGSDLVIGGLGNDLVVGGSGNDILIGGLEYDSADDGNTSSEQNRFIAGVGNDIILDFDVDQGGETSFDTLEFDFAATSYVLESLEDFLDFIDIIESDGDTGTDALAIGNDLVLVLSRVGGTTSDAKDSITIVDFFDQDEFNPGFPLQAPPPLAPGLGDSNDTGLAYADWTYSLYNSVIGSKDESGVQEADRDGGSGNIISRIDLLLDTDNEEAGEGGELCDCDSEPVPPIEGPAPSDPVADLLDFKNRTSQTAVYDYGDNSDMNNPGEPLGSGGGNNNGGQSFFHGSAASIGTSAGLDTDTQAYFTGSSMTENEVDEFIFAAAADDGDTTDAFKVIDVSATELTFQIERYDGINDESFYDTVTLVGDQVEDSILAVGGVGAFDLETPWPIA
ncbi:MAG: calcium-binding protein [Pseudomonadota bacterium]